ncbi:MAG TPA: putative ABC exporter domain-containing protein [Opitutaceae bacterium]|nr:putative ABC exporter domain-containing protein [Opitutaceae bacterium]
MIRAVLFLEYATIVNAVRNRIMRLRQPRYLFGAIVGVCYMYFAVIRRVQPGFHHGGMPPAMASAATLNTLELIGSLILVLNVLGTWIFGGSRAALNFTEPEIAFLFPAPVSRRSLIHFRLLRGQFRVLITALFLGLLSQRWTSYGGSTFVHALGWWLILSFLNLHFIAAAFTKDRLLEAGLSERMRRFIVIGATLILVVVALRWIQKSTANLSLNDSVELEAFVARVFSAPALHIVLWPFQLLVRPFLAPTLREFLVALPAAMVVLLLQYLWVIKAEVSFEEATIARARRRAEAGLARQGPSRVGIRKATREQKEPFELRATGRRFIAFYWKAAIEIGPYAHPRTFATVGAIAIATMLWLLHMPAFAGAVKIVCVVIGILGAYGLILSPIIFRRAAQRMVDTIEVSKAYPIGGWEIVLGELVCPISIVAMFEWILITLLAVVGCNSADVLHQTPVLIATAAVGAGLVLPPLNGLLFAINCAIILYFPAWISTGPNSGQGIERLGQRLIFAAGYLLIMAVGLVPAVALGGGVFLLAVSLSSTLVIPVGLFAIVAAAVLLGEFALVVAALGRRYERFDLSAELPR